MKKEFPLIKYPTVVIKDIAFMLKEIIFVFSDLLTQAIQLYSSVIAVGESLITNILAKVTQLSGMKKQQDKPIFYDLTKLKNKLGITSNGKLPLSNDPQKE